MGNMTNRPATVRRLTSADKVNLAVEAPDTPMHVAAILVVDGRPLCGADGSLRLGDLRARILERLAYVPAMRCRLARRGRSATRAGWVDDVDFRIDRHVLTTSVSWPGDEAALWRTTEDLLARPLDRSHPLWRLWFITGLPAGRVGVVIALHHAMADGASAIHLLSKVFGTAGGAQSVSSAATAPDQSRSSASTATSLRTAWRAITNASHAPRTSLTGPIGPRRRLAVVRFDLATAIAVGRTCGGTVNDVVLDVVAGALRSVLISRAEPVDGVALHAAVPVAAAASPHTVAGNNAGVMVVRLPLGDSDPKSRLDAIRAETAAVKRSQTQAVGTHLLVWLARTGVMRQITRHQHITNTVVSNVVGPRSPITLIGAPVADLIPVGPLAGNLASSFLAFSYAGALTITVRVDADRFPDLDILTEAMSYEWRRLAAGVSVDRRDR
jgi:diacylglycerol O-acyltransferase / wax synthase